MDIDLLAKMVREAILDHDMVTLPGVGCFVAELMPSTFSDKGYTINPPYRRLFFSPRQGNDTILRDLYVDANRADGVDAPMAERILTEFLAEMKEILKVRKTVVFPGLGRLRATRENHFFFVADEDLDIWPEGLGLAPISLKTHVETPEEVASAVAGLAELMAEPVEEIPGQAGNDGGEAVSEPVLRQAQEPAQAQEPVQAQEPAQAQEPEKEQPQEPEQVQEQEPEPEQVLEPVVEPEPVEEIPDQAGNDGEEAVPEPVLRQAKEPEWAQEPVRKAFPKGWKVALIVLGALVILLILFALMGRLAPGWVDKLLYSSEELEILRY